MRNARLVGAIATASLLGISLVGLISVKMMGHERRGKLLSVLKGQWVFFTVKRGLKARYKRGL
jgi:hypothetical protein